MNHGKRTENRGYPRQDSGRSRDASLALERARGRAVQLAHATERTPEDDSRASLSTLQLQVISSAEHHSKLLFFVARITRDTFYISSLVIRLTTSS